MKIVASTKLARAQRAMSDSRTYGQTSNTVFDKAETKPLEGGKTLIIVSSSDKGLCGGIHSQITKAVRRKLLATPDADLVILGEKCKAQLGRSSAKNIVMSFANVGKYIPTFAEAQTIADQIFQLEKDYDNIEVVYNNFKSAISYEPGSAYAFSEETIKNSGKTSTSSPTSCYVSPSYIAPFDDEEYSDVKTLLYCPRARNRVDISVAFLLRERPRNIVPDLPRFVSCRLLTIRKLSQHYRFRD